MDRAIESGYEEMAKLGIRMLTPEVGQSGAALDIRNAAQTAQHGTLNSKISETMRAVIAFMINWRYSLKLRASDIKFQLSADFNPAPLGDQWLRLITEWYENGHLSRDTWLGILKANDIIAPDYDDETEQAKINATDVIKRLNKRTNLEKGITNESE